MMHSAWPAPRFIFSPVILFGLRRSFDLKASAQFLISINLYFAVQFISCSFLEHRRTKRRRLRKRNCVDFTLAGIGETELWFAAIVVMVPVTAFFLRSNWVRQKIALGLGMVLIASLVLWPERILSRKDEASQTFLPTMLFVIHADLIRDQMAADLKENASLPYSTDWLERVYVALNSEIAKSETNYPGHYPSLQFDPEYLWFDPSSITTQLRREFGSNISALCDFYRFYYWRTWQRRPFLRSPKSRASIFDLLLPGLPCLCADENLAADGRL